MNAVFAAAWLQTAAILLAFIASATSPNNPRQKLLLAIAGLLAFVGYVFLIVGTSAIEQAS